MAIYIATLAPDKVPNSQVHPQAKLRPLIPEAHENHELLPGTAAIYTQSQKPATAHGKFLILCQVAAEVKGNPDQDRSAAVICLLKNDFK